MRLVIIQEKGPELRWMCAGVLKEAPPKRLDDSSKIRLLTFVLRVACAWLKKIVSARMQMSPLHSDFAKTSDP